jgi:hypothetical protein
MVPQLWPNSTVVLIASGPSLTQEDVDYVQHKAKVIVVNDNYKRAPWADILYACDHSWWDTHQGVPEFKQMKWTQDKMTVSKWPEINFIPGKHSPGLSLDNKLIHFGANSGYQSLNIAVHLGAKKILLLGFDMKLGPNGIKHWFGSHPKRIDRTLPVNKWVTNFATTVKDLDRAGVEVINCSRDTAITCFRRSTIQECVF